MHPFSTRCTDSFAKLIVHLADHNLFFWNICFPAIFLIWYYSIVFNLKTFYNSLR
jgi:hypothetical protein